MPDHLPAQSALSSFWDQLTANPAAADPPELDAATAASVRRLHALAHVQTPAGAQARLQRTIDQAAANRATRSNGKEPRMDLALPLPRPDVVSLPRVAPRSSARTRPPLSARRVAVWAGTALLIIAISGLLAIFWQSAQQDDNLAVPPVVDEIATPAASWTMNGGNAARNRNAGGAGPVSQPAILWSRTASGPDDRLSIALGAGADGVIYAQARTATVALDAATGAELWRSPANGIVAAIDGDGLIVYGNDYAPGDDLIRIRRADGSVVWTADPGLVQVFADYPAVLDGVVYVPIGAELATFDATTGEERWRAPLAATASRGAAVDNGIAVIGDEQGTLYGIATESGEIHWTYQTDAVRFSHPAIRNGVVYVAGEGGAVEAFYAIDTASGQLVWKLESGSGLSYRPAAVGDTLVFVPSEDGSVSAVEAASGNPVWQFSTGQAAAGVPTVAGDLLYVTSGSGDVIALDAATGEERWRLPLDAAAESTAMIVDGVLFANTVNGTLYAIGSAAQVDPATPTEGTPITGATVAPGGAEIGPPTFAWSTRGEGDLTLTTPLAVEIAPDGKIWVADMSGRFIIFDADGNALESWGSEGTGPGQFVFDTNWWAAFFAFAPDGSFYVSDINNRRIQQFDANRNFVREWGATGNGRGDGEFVGPGEIVILPDGTLLIADADRADVQHFTADGVFIDSFTAEASADGPLVLPVGLAVDPQGRMFVTELEGGRVRIFGAYGVQVGLLDGADLEPPFFSNAINVEVDRYGYISVIDQNHSLIRVYAPDLSFAFQWGTEGDGLERLRAPGWMAIGADGAVYVSDSAGFLVRFNLPGFPWLA